MSLYSKVYVVEYAEGDKSLERTPTYLGTSNKVQYDYVTVKYEDTLESLARDKYGDPSRWYEIADTNNLIDPYDLTPGTVLALKQH